MQQDAKSLRKISKRMAYEICPRVWFGPAGATYNPEFMSRITHIVNCDNDRHSTNLWARNGRTFLFLESMDNDVFPILETHFARLKDFVDAALASPENCVFLHCYLGINRSAALAVAYACYATQKTAKEVIANVRNAGKPILLNHAFEQQLLGLFPPNDEVVQSV